ncbi:hypothetical protein N1031_17090 [Herbiconiux moechotypicola]|uniref:GGDEF domain-containing protein n=1 Tax=Herbiconiux moechotypicola TaxID=637393 RepID=A0ABN3DRG3_9MICO|nr:hypothetical protein [Herbiconiux moechotypicola]MCS5731479.1 hypothetical protein [Herbiconiux moechotypicola]
MGPDALFAAMTFVVAPLATLFYVDKLRRPSEASGRYWALAFSAVLLCSVAYFVSAQSGDVWWSVAVGNGAMVLTLAALWSGCRAFNGGHPLGAVTVLVSLLVTVVSALPSADGAKWAGAPEKMLALAVFSVLIVIEAMRPRLRSFAGSVVLVAVFSVHAVYVTLRVCSSFLHGVDSSFFGTWFSTGFTTAMNLVLVALGGGAIISIRFQQARRELTRESASGRRQRFVSPRAFDSAAARMLADGGEQVMVVLAIDSYDRMRGAFGPAQAKALREDLAHAVLAEAPESVVLGRGASYYLVLLEGDTAAAVDFAARVQRDYTRRRASKSPSQASAGVIQASAGSTPRSLADAARLALARDSELQPGRIRVG